VVPTCPRCWRPCVPVAFTADDYSELLGLYLGDGHIVAHARAQRLRIFLDARYPEIVDETEALLRRCFPRNRVGRVLAHGGRMVTLWLYHQHLACLLPQHGAGKKHLRRIALEPWQTALIEAAPFAFIRGCIRSDGCVSSTVRGPMSTCPTSSTTTRPTYSACSSRRVVSPGWIAGRPPATSASTAARASRDSWSTSRGNAESDRYSASTRGCGGIGLRARFRSVWGKPLGGSSPLSRTPPLPCVAGPRRYRLGD
jgi:hypothetical protein